MRPLLVGILLIASGACAGAQADDDAVTLEGLLEAVRQGRVVESRENTERINRFRREQSSRQKMLVDIIVEEQRAETLSKEQEAEFDVNEKDITELENKLKERMGSLKELFGVLQQVSSDAQAQFYSSLTQLEYPQRNDFLVDFAGRMGQANRLPALSEIEKVWFELQKEMVESGRIVTSTQKIVNRSGQEIEAQVTRVGLFNVVADGKYLQYIPETGRLVEFARQPGSRYLQGPRAIAAGDPGPFPFAIDPVRGQLLSILTQAPNLRERIGQGGVIGYIILGLGTFAILLAIARYSILLLESQRIRRQLDDLHNPLEDNALGRILLAYKALATVDIETLELKMGESVLREVPLINRHLPLLKIIAAVAPLLGLTRRIS